MTRTAMKLEKLENRVNWLSTQADQGKREYDRTNNIALYRRKKNEWINNNLEEIERDRRSQRIKKLTVNNIRMEPKTRFIKNEDGQTEYDSGKVNKILSIIQY